MKPSTQLFLVVIAAVVVASSALKAAGGNTCSVVARPCDETWASGQNQTFAFLGIAQPNLVQLYSYWGTNKGCLNHTDMGGANATSLSLSWATCSTTDSTWTYGPGAIQTFVYYNNSHNGCLSLLVNASHPTDVALGIRPCCAHTNNCTAVEASMQMWLEPPTQKNPYSRILSQYSVNSVPYCLTRIGVNC